MSWWNKGSQEWREEFLARIDTPVMDQSDFAEDDNPMRAFLRRNSIQIRCNLPDVRGLVAIV
jgi:hypothetical protein